MMKLSRKYNPEMRFLCKNTFCVIITSIHIKLAHKCNIHLRDFNNYHAIMFHSHANDLSKRWNFYASVKCEG